MGVLYLPRNALFLSIVSSSRFSLRVSGTNSTALFPVTVALNAVSKTEARSFGQRQPRLDQAWFWAPEWQAMEREAEEDLAAGRYEDFETIDDFIDDLERLMEER